MDKNSGQIYYVQKISYKVLRESKEINYEEESEDEELEYDFERELRIGCGLDELTLHDSGWDSRIIEQFMSEIKDTRRDTTRQ